MTCQSSPYIHKFIYFCIILQGISHVFLIIYNTEKGASYAMELAVKNAVKWAKGDKLKPVVHTDPSDPYYKVVETEKYLEIFRITDDEPED